MLDSQKHLVKDIVLFWWVRLGVRARRGLSRAALTNRAETLMIWPPVYTNQDAFIARNNTGDRTNDWGNNVVAVKSN